MAEIIPFERVGLQRQLERGGMPSRRLLEHALPLAVARRRRRARADWLKAWRKRLGISQREAAEILGYGHRYEICRIEAGYRNPSWEKIFLAMLEEDLRSREKGRSKRGEK